MAEGAALSTTDLFLLMVGLYKLKAPDENADSGEKYWLKDGALRDSEWNLNWFASPQNAWESVRHRDWLIAALAVKIIGENQDFSAISEPMLVSLDLLSDEIKPGMINASEATKQIVVNPKSGYERSFLTALSIGLSKRKSGDQEVVLLGAGMRRRTRVWAPGVEDEALQADVEFFVPFYVAPGTGQSADDLFPGARSICAGISVKRVNGSAIGPDPDAEEHEKKTLAAVRFNFRIPFTLKPKKIDPNDINLQIPSTVPKLPKLPSFWEPGELGTTFEEPVISVQKQQWVAPLKPAKGWEKFKNWEEFVKDFCDSTDGGELLNAPIGPLLVEQASYTSLKDLYGYKEDDKGKPKEDYEAAKKEFAETLQLLNKFWEVKAPDEPEEEEETPPAPNERKLGGLLVTLGLLEGKRKKDHYEYSTRDLDKLTVWDVLNGLFAELDGFPLYIGGVEREDKGKRMAIALAAQASQTDPRKQYFGLVGLAYDIPVKTVSENDPKAEDGDANAARITLDADQFTKDHSILIIDDEEDEANAPPPKKPEEAKDKEKEKSTVEVKLHLGKWFNGETLDDNWFRRLLPPVKSDDDAVPKRKAPLPGLRLLPFRRVQSDDNTQQVFSLAPRLDLLSLGFDVKGTTEKGLTFLQFNKGPLAYFGLGAVEVRLSLLTSSDRIAFGFGIKLKNLRLSFGRPLEEEEEDQKKDDGTGDILKSLKVLLGEDDWVVSAAPKKPKERTVKTRLGATKKDMFSLSFGYLMPLSEGHNGTLDIQLYDQKGKRGGTVFIPLDRRIEPVYLKHIGIGLKGIENTELGKGLREGAELTLEITGGLRFPSFELGLIGARITMSLTKPRTSTVSLDGLDISMKIGPAIISGSFLKQGVEFAGLLTIDLPKFSIGAMGFYGPLLAFKMTPPEAVINELKSSKLHPDLRAMFDKEENKPAYDKLNLRRFEDGHWELDAKDGRRYLIFEDDGKLQVYSPDKTFFFFGMVNAAAGGGGVRIGPIEITGIAAGFGIHRRIKIPAIEEVAEFPFVKMVMGEGGYQKKSDSLDVRQQLGKPAKDPVSVLEDMKDWLIGERGQYFGCAGVRFTIATTVDCFGLLIIQAGNEFELTLLGLARFKHPREVTAKAICYVELQLLMTIKPNEGVFKLQALLTSNSWIINQDCRLTGGFALFVWFDGKHKGDFVISLGGYHPRFQRPDHYPVVPRLGLNWPITPGLTIKGGAYLAVTSSCFMLGGKLEAMFQSGRLSVMFTFYFDAVIAWSPFHFEYDIGVSLRAEFATAIYTLKVTLSTTIKMWGPPVGGVVRIDWTVISKDIPFGASREEAKPQLINSWAQFCRSFLNASEADKKAAEKPVTISPVVRANLAAGRYNASNPSAPERQNAQPKRATDPWQVRADELVLAASTAVPVNALNVGSVKTNSPPAGVQERDLTGKSLLVPKPVVLDETKKQHVKKYADPLGVHPMGKTLQSVLNVTIVRDDVSATRAVDLTDWTIEEETGSLPAALWDAAKPDSKHPPEPSAKLIADCITGLKRLKPPDGQRGQQVRLSKSEITWERLHTEPPVAKSGASHELPSKTRARNVQSAMADKQAEQKRVADALAAVGFDLAFNPDGQPAIRFRELQAEPLAGAVATR
jgi:hypothetical protein